jgi:hypothetical protein
MQRIQADEIRAVFPHEVAQIESRFTGIPNHRSKLSIGYSEPRVVGRMSNRWYDT